MHLAANVSALGFTVSECLQIFACIQFHLKQANICCFAVGPAAVATSFRRDRVIVAMRVCGDNGRAGDPRDGDGK